MPKRKSWRDKLEKAQEPRVVEIPPKMRKRLGTGTLLIPAPLEVDGLIRTVKTGEVATYSQIRRVLADRYGATQTCPMVTGIFVWLAAHASEEDAQAGEGRITPYWRVLKDDGSLNPKFPGGVEAQAKKLRAEGHRIETGRAVPRVRGFEERLALVGKAKRAVAR